MDHAASSFDPDFAHAAAAGNLTLGFMPLVDAATLIVAHEQGFAQAEGLTLTLVREASWANIRDRVALGHFDAAHMLGPIPIASSLGVGRPAVPMAAPFALGLGGNAITLSARLFAAMRAVADAPAAFAAFDPTTMSRALAAVIRQRQVAGREPLSLAVVHPLSAHTYVLRYWLAAAGIDPDEDIRIMVVPPAATVAAITDGQIDGFCAGEPWNSLAVEAGAGVMAVTTSALWRQGPDKVLGMRTDFTERHPAPTAALVRALFRAALWADTPENGAELAATLARPDYLDAPAATIRRALDGRLVREPAADAAPVPDFFILTRHAANFPWLSHALWFYAQMARCGQVEHSSGNAATATGVYRPDLYRAALASTDADLPRASAKVEGALQHPTPVASRSGRLALGPDGFFDGRLFDPDHLDQYIGFPARSERASAD